MDTHIRTLERSQGTLDTPEGRLALVRSGKGPDFRDYLKRHSCYPGTRHRPGGFRGIRFADDTVISIQAGNSHYSHPKLNFWDGTHGNLAGIYLTPWEYETWEVLANGDDYERAGVSPDVTSDGLLAYEPTEKVQTLFLLAWSQHGDPKSMADE